MDWYYDSDILPTHILKKLQAQQSLSFTLIMSSLPAIDHTLVPQTSAKTQGTKSL